MRGFLAIVRREAFELRAILYAAVFAAFIPVLAPLLPLSGADADVRGWVALILAASLGVGLTVALGASLLVPEMASRRIAFDLSRPVSSGAIWLGHLVAGVALALAAAAIVWIPSWIAGARPVWSDLPTAPLVGRFFLVLVLAVLPLLFLAMHALALAFRSKSPLIVLDALLALVAAFGIRAVFIRLPASFAHGPRVVALVGLAAAAEVALLAAGYASVDRGRVDVLAAHRSLSVILWALLLTGVAGANVYALWVMSASPANLAAKSFGARAAGSGPWVALYGETRGASATFLYDTTTGRNARLRTTNWRAPAISRDGTHAAWVGEAEGSRPRFLQTWNLADPHARPAATRILLGGDPSLLELSEDGSRVATWENGMLSIHDVAGERTLAAARLPVADDDALRGNFVGPADFRVYRIGAKSIEIFRMDLIARTLERLGAIEGRIGYFVVDPSGSRLVMINGREVRLFDGATGAAIATLADEPARSRWPWMLADGRVAVSEYLPEGRLRFFGSDGKALQTIALPPSCNGGVVVSRVVLGGEVAPDQVVVGCTGLSGTREIWLADARAGAIRKAGDGLVPILAFGLPAAIGSEATRLFYGPNHRSLVRFDPLTGERRTLLGKP